MPPLPGESPLSVEFGLIMLAVGALIFMYLIWKLVREYRARRDGEP